MNAFAYVNQHFFGGDGTANVTVTLNDAGNTQLTYTGSHPILQSYTFDYGGGPGAPHFGFVGSAGSKVIGQFWTNSAEIFTNLPSLSVTGPGSMGSNIDFALFFAEVSCNSQTEGQWNELSFVANTTPKLTLTNPTSCSETLSDVGFLLSDVPISADLLNFGHEPPPGEPGSNFVPLSLLDGEILQPGDSLSIDLVPGVPEPSSLFLLATAAGLLAFGSGGHRNRWRHYRRRQGVSLTAGTQDRARDKRILEDQWACTCATFSIIPRPHGLHPLRAKGCSRDPHEWMKPVTMKIKGGNNEDLNQDASNRLLSIQFCECGLHGQVNSGRGFLSASAGSRS